MTPKAPESRTRHRSKIGGAAPTGGLDRPPRIREWPLFAHQRTFPTAGRMGEIDPQLLRHSRDPQGARDSTPLRPLLRITAGAADTIFQTLTPIGSDGSAG